MKNALFVFLGGGAGSVLRYLFGVAYFKVAGSSLTLGFPWATLACNIGASLMLGWLARQQVTGLHPTFWLLMAVGVCGGWSTFSTFSMDAVLLMKSGRVGTAIVYMALSFGFSLVAFWLGYGPIQKPDSAG